MTSIAKSMLFLGGCLGLALALFQAIISCVPAWSLYFGAPAEIVENRWLLLLLGEIAAVFFGIFGLYGLSGAGTIRRFPLLRLGLLVISGIFILRGLAFIPQLFILLSALPTDQEITPRWLLFSLISLVIGLIYAIGTVGAWRDLSPEKEI